MDIALWVEGVLVIVLTAISGFFAASVCRKPGCNCLYAEGAFPNEQFNGEFGVRLSRQVAETTGGLVSDRYANQ